VDDDDYGRYTLHVHNGKLGAEQTMSLVVTRNLENKSSQSNLNFQQNPQLNPESWLNGLAAMGQ